MEEIEGENRRNHFDLMAKSGVSIKTSPTTPLVSTDWLESHLGDPKLRILDATLHVRVFPFPFITSGKRGWRRAHIPGAVYADLRKLSDPARRSYTFTLPSPAHFAGKMGELGIGAGSRVVVYDSRQNMWAARLWWMLRYFGFDDAYVLDGGWSAWQRSGHSQCSIPCVYPSAKPFTSSPRHDLVADRREVLAAIDDPSISIVSALGRRQHRGERNEYRRRGHIPGAKNVTAWEILDRGTQRYRPLPELRERFDKILGAERVIVYCGSGIAASSDALVLQLLGHQNVAVYDGGLVEWNRDRTLPVELGD